MRCATSGREVGIVDADIYGWSVPGMLGIQQRPISLDGMIIPPVAHDLRVMSIGFFLEQEGAIIWRGPMLHRALEQFLSDVHWGALDYLVVDMPPGTGDVGLSLGQLMPRAEAIVVTTPQPAAQRVAERAAAMVQKVGQTLVGVVENMSGYACPCCGERTAPFGEGGGARARRAARRPAARRGAARAGAARGLRRRPSAVALGAREPGSARDHGHRRAARRHAAGGPGPCRIAARHHPGLADCNRPSTPFEGLVSPGPATDTPRMPLDELQALALMRARDQARAVLGVVRDAMVEIEHPALLAVCALLADGHLLIEDVPGVGKTTLARVVARAIGGHDARIQCTGDLAAEDVVGRLIPADGFRDETFEHGPIFANAVVFDEFNRATPRLQSALLAAMEERVVTAGKQRHALPRPFFAVGTMNPHDNSGTYELGFAQRDRFAIRTGLGYASARGEVDLIERFSAFDVTAEIDPIIAPGDLVKLQRAVGLVRASPRGQGVSRRARARHARPSRRRGRRVAARDPHDVPLLPVADDAAQ